MKTPAVGRVVHVVMQPELNNGSDVAPGVITRVWSDACVNVKVLLDGRDNLWKTSISLHPNREAVEAKRAELMANRAPGDDRPVVMHAAYWPPTV